MGHSGQGRRKLRSAAEPCVTHARQLLSQARWLLSARPARARIQPYRPSCPALLTWLRALRRHCVSSFPRPQISEVQKKKRRTAAKSNNRSIVGTSLEVIQKKRAEKPEVRQASREAAIREVKVGFSARQCRAGWSGAEGLELRACWRGGSAAERSA